jgi:hypothetical protein
MGILRLEYWDTLLLHFRIIRVGVVIVLAFPRATLRDRGGGNCGPVQLIHRNPTGVKQLKRLVRSEFPPSVPELPGVLSTHPQQGHQISRAMDAVSLEQFVQGHTPILSVMRLLYHLPQIIYARLS